jgi:O-antigen/teichoic acid export membrane protein
MFSSFLAILKAFTGLRANSALSVRFFQQEQFYLPAYVSTCLIILVLSGAGVLSVTILSLDFLENYTKVPSKWLVIAVITSCSQFIVQTLLNILIVSRKPFIYGVLQISQSAMNVGFSLFLIIIFSWAWEGRAAGQCLGISTISVVSFIILWKGGWISAAPQRYYAVDALKFGLPLIPHTIGAILISMTNRFLITNIMDVKQTGIYMVGLQVGMVLGLLADSFNKSYSPWLFQKLENIDDQGKYQIVRYTYLYFIGALVIAVSMGLIAPFLIRFLIGEQFRNSSSIVIYIAIGCAFQGMYFMVTNYIFYVSKTYLLAIITLSCGLFNIAISYFLIKYFGLKGAAFGFMISQAVFFISTWFLSHKSYPMPWMRAISF